MSVCEGGGGGGGCGGGGGLRAHLNLVVNTFLTDSF